MQLQNSALKNSATENNVMAIECDELSVIDFLKKKQKHIEIAIFPLSQTLPLDSDALTTQQWN